MFREDALRRHSDSQHDAVQPRLYAPRVFRAVWVMAGLSLAGGAVVWFMEVPVYVAGQATVVTDGAGAEAMIALLPAEDGGVLRQGQRVFLKRGPDGAREEHVLRSVEPAAVSPAAVRERFATTSCLEIKEPVALATLGDAGAAEAKPGVSALGSSWPVHVEVGTRRLVSFLPGLRRLAGVS